MDLETRGTADPPAVQGALPSLSCLEAPDQFGLDLSETRTPSPATGRRGDRPVEADALAAYKKTPRDVVPTSSSWMNRAFCSSPMWPAPGPRKAARQSCGTATSKIGFRRSAPWPCHPNGDEWRFIFDCAAGISLGWMSAHSCNTCSGICGAPLSCCGIVARSIAGKKSDAGLPRILDCTWKSFQPMPPTSIRQNTSGPRPIGPWQTVRPWTCFNSTGCSDTRCDGFVTRQASYGPVFTRLIFHGHGEDFHYLCKAQ